VSARAAGPGATRWLPWGDAASLLGFTVFGLRFHNIALTLFGVLQTAAPLIAAWFLCARVLHTYARPAAWRFLATWVLAVPLGLAARQVWLARSFGGGFLVFLAVAGTFTLVFLGAWRALAAGLARLRSA
jgi:hypothetical protein